MGDEDNSSSDDSEDVEDGVASSSRSKRSVKWCGNKHKHETSKFSHSHSPNISWPPDQSNSHDWRSQLRKVQKPGNPYYGTKMQLFSKTNYNIGIYADGCVRGTMDDDDLHTHLELISAGRAGHVRIQGILTKLYIAMDHKGRLYGEPDVMEEGTVFIEDFQASYNSYLSRKYAHLGWYLGIKKSGKFKKGPQTSYRQKACHFLPRRSKFE